MTAINHEAVAFDVAHEAILGDVVAAGRALHDADLLALEARISQRIDAIKAGAGFVDERRGRAIDRVCVQNHVVALAPTDHEIAFLSEKRHANEPGGLGEPCVDHGYFQFLGD